jgi:hypothetical protein
MKHYKKTNLYKASNVTFDPIKMEATSYNWWLFVKRIKGKTVFNSYRYSVSTSKHQSKVRSLMSQLGIRIDRYVQVADGIQYISTLTELNKKHNETLKRIAEREEEKRIARLERQAFKRKEKRLSDYLENECAFRDYEIKPKSQADWNRPDGAISQVVTSKDIKIDVQNALKLFQENAAHSIYFFI